MEEIDDFKNILNLGVGPEGSATEKNKFFAELFEDRLLTTQFLLFAIDGMQRLALLNRQTIEVKKAKQLIGYLPIVAKYYEDKRFKRGGKVEEMLQEVNNLNHEYEGLRRILVALVHWHGPQTLTRELLQAVDSRDLTFDYNSTLDCIKVGTAQTREVAKRAEDTWDKEQRAKVESAKVIDDIPRLYKDGNDWCVKVAGVIGIGTTPEEALVDCNKRRQEMGWMFDVEMEDVKKVEEDCTDA